MARLADRIAIVTGGSRGIGAAAAHAMAREGATVVLASRKQDGIDTVAAAINAEFPGRAFARALHVGHTEEIADWVAAVCDDIGIPDIVLNNAGTNVYHGPMLDAPWPAWHKTFQVNLEGAFELSRQVARRLVAAEQPGSIVNVSSVNALRVAENQGIYAMTKAALISLSQTMALELGPHDIRVNAIAPGFVETRLAGAYLQDPEHLKHIHRRTPLGRVAKPEEISGLCVYLASNESSYVTGQVFVIDGGWTLH